MNILIDIGHPGHVHLFRNLYHKLVDSGHYVSVTTRDIPIAIRLLDYYNIPYVNIGNKKDTLFGKAISVIKQDIKILRIVLSKKIDIGISSGLVLPHISKLTSMKSIVFDDDDDEMEELFVKYGHSFADVVLSPSCIKRSTSKNIPYDGIHELAYLHPNYFRPDESVLERAGIQKGEAYFILRFVALKGHHDIGHKGISLEQKKRIIKTLLRKGKVFITAEREIEDCLERYRIPVKPEEMHSFIYYSSMFLGDSQTMTSEAAVLGVPALKCNTFAGKLSVPNVLEEKYDLCYSFLPSDFELFMNKLDEILTDNNYKNDWKSRKLLFLENNIDVTSFMLWFVSNYPESQKLMKSNPDYINIFK